MSFFGQLSSRYNAKDNGQNISDVLGVVNLLSEKQRSIVMSLIVSQEGIYKIRTIIYTTLIESIGGKAEGEFGRIDRFNSNYQALLFLYETIASNGLLLKGFLQTLEHNIEQQLLGYESRVNIAEIIDTITDDNFDQKVQLIEDLVGHEGVIYFLEECIRANIVHQKVSQFVAKKQKVNLEDASLEDLDYLNLASLRAFQKMFNSTKENSDGVSFALSGGISNAFIQLGVIKKALKSGKKITSIAGTSMGGILAVLVSKAIEKDGNIDTLILKLKEKFRKKGRLYVKKRPEYSEDESGVLSTKPVDQRYDIRDIFIDIAQEYGINQDSTFNQLQIPVIVNASYQSPKGQGEKEIILSGDEKIIESLRVGANMPGISTDNRGILGRQGVRGLGMVDYAANEKGVPISLLARIGVKQKNIIAVDVGYSSSKYKTFLAQFSRKFFPRALLRDFVDKFGLIIGGGTVVETNAAESNNGDGSLFSAEVIDKLVSIGENS